VVLGARRTLRVPAVTIKSPVESTAANAVETVKIVIRTVRVTLIINVSSIDIDHHKRQMPGQVRLIIDQAAIFIFVTISQGTR
jgi:Na+-transporting NADH:ubiquinone oxidoreductase subunit NqrD